jgi:hypothetical protein
MSTSGSSQAEASGSGWNYDWVTRKRLHVAYIAAVAWTIAVQVTALSVYLNPRWAPVALRLLGR